MKGNLYGMQILTIFQWRKNERFLSRKIKKNVRQFKVTFSWKVLYNN